MQMIGNNFKEIKEEYCTKFLEPKHGIVISCPVHGQIGKASIGGELYCPSCFEWFPAIPKIPMTQNKLEKKQNALKARLARREYRRLHPRQVG